MVPRPVKKTFKNCNGKYKWWIFSGLGSFRRVRGISSGLSTHYQLESLYQVEACHIQARNPSVPDWGMRLKPTKTSWLKSCHAKKKRKKELHISTCKQAARERYPNPRETTPLSLKIPPSRDTAPCFIQFRASNKYSQVSYTWTSPRRQ